MSMAVVLAENDDSFRTQAAPRPAVTSDTLHVIFLLRDSGDNRAAYEASLGKPEKHIHALCSVR